MFQRLLPPDPSGAGIQAVCLSKELRKRGYDVLLLGDNLHGGRTFEEIDGIPAVRLRPLHSASTRGRLFAYWLRQALSLFRLRKRFDILHVHGIVFPNSFSAVMGKWLRKPVIMKASLEGEFAGLRTSRGEKLHYGFLKSVDHFVLISHRLVHEYRSSGLPPGRSTYIPNGVDTTVFQPVCAEEKAKLRAKLGLPSTPILVYHGVFGERKAIHWLLDAVEDYLRTSPLKLLLVGSPTRDEQITGYYNGVLRRIHSSALRYSVIVREFCDDVHEFLQASDAYILPSRREGLANALLEAMAVGLVPLVSRTSGSEELVVHEESGFLFEPMNAQSLLSCLRRYAEMRGSGQDREMSEAAVRTITHGFSIESVADRYESLYDAVVQERQR